MTKGAFCQESFSCECAPGISSFCDGREVHFLVPSPLNWRRWSVCCDQHCLVISRRSVSPLGGFCISSGYGTYTVPLMWLLQDRLSLLELCLHPSVLTALLLSVRPYPVSAGEWGYWAGTPPPSLVPPGDSWLLGYYQQGPLTSRLRLMTKSLINWMKWALEEYPENNALSSGCWETGSGQWLIWGQSTANPGN